MSKSDRICIFVLILAVIVIATPPVSAEPARFYPQGRTLLFGIYSLAEPELSEAISDGYTLVGPWARGGERTIKSARSSGLPVVYRVGPRMGFKNIHANPDIDAGLEELAAEVAQQSAQDEIAVWYLADEELRYWRSKEMAWLAAASKIIRANDPYERPIMMYEPNHRLPEGMIITSAHLDFITRGAYANHVGLKDKRTWIRWAVTQAVDAARETGKMPIAVLWMVKDQIPEDVAMIDRWTRHDVYLSLVTGAKGIMIWSGSNRRKEFQKHFRNFYDGYAAAASELAGDLRLADPFLFGEPQQDISIVVTSGPPEQSYTYLEKEYTYPSVSWSRLNMDDQRFLFLVNSNSAEVTIQIEGIPDGIATQDRVTGRTLETNTELVMEPYAVHALAWQERVDHSAVPPCGKQRDHVNLKP